MKKEDTLLRFVFDNAPVRGEYINLGSVYQTIALQHPYPEPVKTLLAEALAVSGLLSAIIKFDGRLTLQFRGNGKLKLLIAQCNNNFEVRGLAKWEDNITQEDLLDAFKDGVLVITLDSATNKVPYQGIVTWRGNSLAESIEGYFKESEQLATRVWLSVDEKNASGLLLQVIPAAENGLSKIEEDIVAPRFEALAAEADRLAPEALQEDDFEAMIKRLYPAEDIRVFPAVSLHFKCSCSRRKGEEAILLLGRDEAMEEIKNKHTIVVTCDFCNDEYLYDKNDIEILFKDSDQPSSVH